MPILSDLDIFGNTEPAETISDDDLFGAPEPKPKWAQMLGGSGAPAPKRGRSWSEVIQQGASGLASEYPAAAEGFVKELPLIAMRAVDMPANVGARATEEVLGRLGAKDFAQRIREQRALSRLQMAEPFAEGPDASAGEKFGRGAARVAPQVALGVATSGASLPVQMGLGAAAQGAQSLSEGAGLGEAAGAATLAGGGQAVGPAAKWLLAPAAKTLNRGVLDAANRLGQELPASALTNSSFVKRLEGYASNVLGGQQVNQRLEDAVEGLSGIARRASSGGDATEVGRQIGGHYSALDDAARQQLATAESSAASTLAARQAALREAEEEFRRNAALNVSDRASELSARAQGFSGAARDKIAARQTQRLGQADELLSGAKGEAETARQAAEHGVQDAVGEQVGGASDAQFGRQIAEAFDQWRQQGIIKSRGLWRPLKGMLQGTRGVPESTLRRMQELAADESVDPGFRSFLSETIERLAPGEEGPRSLEALRGAKRLLSGKAQSYARDPLSDSMTKNLARELDTTLGRDIQGLVPEGSRGAYDEAMGFTRQMSETKRSRWAQAIAKRGKTPSDIPRLVLNPSMAAEDVPRILETLGEDGTRTVRQAVRADLMRGVTRPDGTLNSKALAARIGQYESRTPGKLKALLGDDLEEVQNLSRRSLAAPQAGQDVLETATSASTMAKNAARAEARQTGQVADRVTGAMRQGAQRELGSMRERIARQQAETAARNKLEIAGLKRTGEETAERLRLQIPSNASPFVKRIVSGAKGDPAQLAESLLSPHTSTEQFARVMSEVPDAADGVRDFAYQRLMVAATQGGEAVTPGRMQSAVTAWTKIEPDKLRAILKPEQWQEFNDLLTAAKALQEPKRIMRGSATGGHASLLAKAAGLLVAPLKTLGGTGAEALAARAIGGKTGQRWLTTGLRSAETARNQGSGAGRGLAASVAEAMRAHNTKQAIR
jgi:hypothetical protein